MLVKTIMFVLITASLTFSRVIRHKRLAFNFGGNIPGGKPIDWDNAATVPTLEVSPPDFSIWDINNSKHKQVTHQPVKYADINSGNQNNSEKNDSSLYAAKDIPSNNNSETQISTAGLTGMRTDCPLNQNLCLLSLDRCPPSRECVMNQDCTKIICVHENESLPEPAIGRVKQHTNYISESKKLHNTSSLRTDCPQNKNVCLSVSNHCPPNKECVMNSDCTRYNCVDKGKNISTTTVAMMEEKNQTEASLSVTDGDLISKPLGYRSDCPAIQDLCPRYPPAVCPPHQDCFMNQECNRIRCIDRKRNSTSPEQSHDARQLKFDNTLRPIEDRTCPKNAYYICVHGHCKEDNISCACDKGWIGPKCDLPCTLDCVHGNCSVDSHGISYVSPDTVTKEDMMCFCERGWHTRLCDERVPDLINDAHMRTLTLGASLGAALLVTIVASFVILVTLWHKRVIVVMKLVYFFKPIEDNDGRFYDAYISMGSSTRGLTFVKNSLCPMLEQYGFKLYIQARDQLIGETLSDSILKAMEQSRRTILIVTPDYIENEWSKFECLIAQIETLKLHQRIIPIILEDVSSKKDNMNKTLRHILESVKCLKFPSGKEDPKWSLKEMMEWKERQERKFWKRLELTMPRKKPVHNLNDSGLSELDVKNVKPINITFTDMYSVV